MKMMIQRLMLACVSVIGREEVNGLDAIKVEIGRHEPVRHPLKHREGVLTAIPLWIVWFSAGMGHVPVKIVTSRRYELDGKMYEVEWPAGTPQTFEYVASDITNVFDDVWYPLSGAVRTYRPENSGSPQRDFESEIASLADRLLQDGKLIVDPDRRYLLSTHREWRILKLEKLTTDVDLWFDAPDGACVRDVDTQSFRIQGKTDVESRAILGGPEDTGVGPRPIVATPGASTGRVVFFCTNAALALVVAVYLVRKWRRSA